jgi:signal transduction histidine kinase/FixJ family two-component response regulator
VLVVDDEPSVAELCRDFLVGEGMQLTMAGSGEEAVRLIPELQPDVILSDINLPGMSGLEVMRHAKEMDPDACVIVVTGYASIATAIEALRQGAYDFVRKPFDLEFVHKIIKSGIANRRLKVINRGLIDELREKNEQLLRHEQQLTERVKVATRQLTDLYVAGKEIGANLELGPRLSIVCAKAAQMTGARAAVVYLRQETSDLYRAASAAGAELVFGGAADAHVRTGEGPLGRCASTQRPERGPAGPFVMPGVSDTAAQALLAVPMVTENQVMGVLAVIDKPGGFGADDESFLMQFAAQAAVAVQNSQLFEHTKSLDRLKSEFVAVVTHEIRTPLTSVLSAIELLSDDRYFANNEQQKKLLSIGEANAERLLTLISDILDFSKLESASLSMNLERQRLEPVVRQAVDNLRTLLEERRITLETVLANDLPDIMIDSHRITQVLTNLLSNAIKFSPSSGGRITVGAERWNGMVRVAVSDRGEGITPENLPKLFKKFTQIDSTSTRTRGGAGLGLAISKGIVEQHGGEMSVESVYGEGTTFYFTVRPATSPAAVPAGAARSNGAGR